MRLSFLLALLCSPAWAQFGKLPASSLQAPITNLVPLETKTGFASSLDNVWRNSPDAEHHRAVVRVICPPGLDGNPAAGTGVIVKTTGKGVFALTNHHVVSVGWLGNGFDPRTHSVVTVKGNPGSTKARVIWSSNNLDLALLYSPTATNSHGGIPISTKMPSLGQDVEVCGYGGPTDGLRHFYGQRVQTSYPLSVNAAVVSGDSGGPMIWKGGLIGINWGAPSAAGNRGAIRTQRSGTWKMHGPATSGVDGPTLAKILTQQCGPYGCQPVIVDVPPPQASKPSYCPSGCQANCSCGCSGGKTTPAEPCDCDEAEITKNVTQMSVKAILAYMKENPDEFKGEDGSDGDDGQGKGPTDAQVYKAVEQYFASNPIPVGLTREEVELMIASAPHPDRRIVLVDGKTKSVIDDETWRSDEPMVIDVQNLVKTK